MFNPIRVGVLDRHEIIRYGLIIHLFKQPDITVSGSYGSAAKALRDARMNSWDVLLIGHLPGGNDCVKLIRSLGIQHPRLKFLVVLERPHLAAAVMFLAAGAHGVLHKSQPLADYVDAIRTLAVGELYFCSNSKLTSKHVFDSQKRVPSQGDTVLMHSLIDSAMLSIREREVLRLCASGLTVTQIAIGSARSVKTISAQKQSAYRKLGLKTDLDFFKCFSSRGI